MQSQQLDFLYYKKYKANVKQQTDDEETNP